ncbi:MAG TPA: cytochrome P450 [Streptosporangiaceae bacterium]
MNTVDLASLDFWAQPTEARDRAFEALRGLEERIFCPRDDGPGFYALTRYDQIVEASRNPRVFSSEPTAVSLVDPPPAVQEVMGSMISLDDPRHARLRRIVARAFTPRMIQRASDDVAALAKRIVDDAIEQGPGDFVADVAMPMPLEIICNMMGIPDELRPDIVAATNLLIQSIGDPDYVSPDGRDRTAVVFEQLSYLREVGAELGRRRRANPADDMVTALVTADVDGEALSDADLGRFFTLLVTAGNETTRNALSHALALFTEHGDQRALLLADLEERLPGAVEEVVRYATPVSWMRRNVTREVDLLGQTYHPGDRVVMYYVSANRDERVFADPYGFDITRAPNPHLGFGGPGPHFCLGAHLARREISVMLRELLTRLPNIHATAPPERQRASFVNGIVALPYAF